MKVFKAIPHTGHPRLGIDILKMVPKIELHAHLSCSISRDSFKKLLKRKGMDDDLSFIDRASSNEEVFKDIFPKLVQAIENKSDLKYVTKEVLSSFEDDGVRYAEFRSTAKKLKDHSSELDYVENVLEVIDEWKGSENTRKKGKDPMGCRFILSLNRAYPQEHFFDVIKQVKRDPKWSKYITGLDYSGDPFMRDVYDFRKCFDLAREAGLKLTIHTSELPVHADETPRILSLNPERLGHFIYYTEEEFQIVKENGIHIEACPTSNLITSPVISMPAHPISEMYSRDLNLSICTDDQLLFNKTLSEEIEMVTDAFGYGMEFVEKICRDALKSAFINDKKLKKKLGKEMDDFFIKFK